MSAHHRFDPDGEAAGESGGPGRRLRIVREDQGVPLPRVAAELHLAPATVEALEADDYAALPGPVFVAGYIRNYARLLGMDPEPLLASYRAARTQTEPSRPSAAPAVRPRRPDGGGKPAKGPTVLTVLVGAAVLILVAGGAFLWWQGLLPTDAWYRGHIDRTVPDAIEPAMIEPDATEAELPDATEPFLGPDTGDAAGAWSGPGSPSPSAEVPAASAGLPTDTAAGAPPRADGVDPLAPDVAGERADAAPSDLGSAPTLAPGPAPASTPMRADPAAAGALGESTLGEGPAGEGRAASTGSATGAPAATGEAVPEAAARPEIVLTLDGRCWVDVRDSAQTFKIFGEKNKGDRHVLAGEPPYKITLGNAAVARITIDGEAFDLDAVSRGGVARFTLDPDTLSGDDKPSN